MVSSEESVDTKTTQTKDVFRARKQNSVHHLCVSCVSQALRKKTQDLSSRPNNGPPPPRGTNDDIVGDYERKNPEAEISTRMK